MVFELDSIELTIYTQRPCANSVLRYDSISNQKAKLAGAEIC